jgi:8-oxo-dGTP pyrophosphatase MutT (NUDIX family)
MSSTDVRDDQLPRNAGGAEEVAPLPAASILLLRDDPLEVLMIRRHEKSTFVPNAWVFPGGVAEAQDDAGDVLATMRRTAVRELLEETGITLDPESLVWTSRWITPVGVPKRFDTYFFLAVVPRDVVATVDQSEAVEALWISPADAIGKLQVVFPTMKNLEAISGFTNTNDLVASRRGMEIKTVRPILVVEDGKKRIVLPD